MGKHEQNTDGQAEAEEIERYRKLQEERHHRLPYREYLRAKELGVGLPEADPVYEIAASREEPLAIKMPKGFPLRKCYRMTEELGQAAVSQVDNAYLLSALGGREEPFVPVWIPDEYTGYSWAELPTVDSVDVVTKRLRHASNFGGWRRLECFDTIVVTARTSDGKTHSCSVCLALGEPEFECSRSRQTIYVTPEARSRVPRRALLGFLGVPGEAPAQVTMLDDFWLGCGSDDGAIRSAILERLETLAPSWEAITRTRDNVVTIRMRDGSERELSLK